MKKPNARSRESVNNAIEWRRENTILFNLRLNKTYDADIIKKLESVENKQGYVKDLIRSDMGIPLAVRLSKKEQEEETIKSLEAKYEDCGYLELKKLYTKKHKEYMDGDTSLVYELKAIKNVKARKPFGRPKKK